MKVLVLLSILGLALADPQVIHHPGQHLLQPLPLTTLTPTIKTSDSGLISTYTATYPYGGIPYIQGAMPYTFGYPYMSYPTLVAAKPAEETTSRQKRSADPEPAINFPKIGDIRVTSMAENPAIATIQSPAVAAIPATTLQYTGLPTYTVPAQTTISPTGLTPIVGYPYSGYPTWSGMNPYTTFPWFQTPLTTTGIVTPAVEGSRTKRSADPEPEADPQILTTAGVTGFTYPAINTRTLPSAYTYQNYPMTYSHIPATYTTGFPFQYGGFPAATAVMG